MSPRGRGRGGHPTSLGSAGGKCRAGAAEVKVRSKGLSVGSNATQAGEVAGGQLGPPSLLATPHG